MAPVAAHKLANEQREVATARGYMSLVPSILQAPTLQLIFQKLRKPFKGLLIGSSSTLVKMMGLTATLWIA